MRFIHLVSVPCIRVAKAVVRRIRRVRYKLLLGSLGRGSYVCAHVMIEDGHNVFLGDNVIVNEFVIIQSCQGASVRIGNGVHLSYGAYVLTGGLALGRTLNVARHKRSSVIIEDEAWIGAHAVILPGVRIGRKSVVAAGAVVTKDVDPETVVAGIPATVFRRLG